MKWSNATTAVACTAEEMKKASEGNMSTKEKLESCVQENFPDFGQ